MPPAPAMRPMSHKKSRNPAMRMEAPMMIYATIGFGRLASSGAGGVVYCCCGGDVVGIASQEGVGIDGGDDGGGVGSKAGDGGETFVS